MVTFLEILFLALPRELKQEETQGGLTGKMKHDISS